MDPVRNDAGDTNGTTRQRRSRLRPKTIAGKRLTRAEIQEGIRLVDDMWYERPKTRADCVDGPRPCPFVSCKFHLYLDVNPHNGNIKLNFPGREVWELPETCALDVADRGGTTLEEAGALLNLTRERIRQLEHLALASLRADTSPAALALADHLDAEPPGPVGNLRARVVGIRHTPDAAPRGGR